jgi:hypothetical protein
MTRQIDRGTDVDYETRRIEAYIAKNQHYHQGYLSKVENQLTQSARNVLSGRLQKVYKLKGV